MKPNFALDLSEDGIVLLHRHPSGDGWVREGRVDFASDDIAQGLASLRARAIELEGDGFQTKLILPHSQLLFTSVAPGEDIAATLEARTPYRADQLSFDSYVAGGEVHVIAVALETLGEAEGFIEPHGLNPVGFTTIPQSAVFAKEPMLGGVLAGADRFATDLAPIKVIDAPAPAPEPDPAPELEPEPEPEVQAEPEPEIEPVAAPVEDVAAPASEAPSVPETVPEAEPVEDAAAATAETKAQEAQSKPKPVARKDGATPPAIEEVPASTGSGTGAAAFSSRRRAGTTDDTGAAKARLTQLSARIGVPDGAAPKLGGAPARDTKPSEPARKTRAKPQKTEPILRTRKGPKPAPIVPPVAAPAPAAAEPAPKRAKKADPLAELAQADRRGKPRFLGVILTAILIAFLGLAALLSSYLLPEDAVSSLFGRDAPQEAEEVAILEPEPELDATPAPEPLIEPALEAETPFDQEFDQEIDQEITQARLPTEQTLPEFDTDEPAGSDIDNPEFLNPIQEMTQAEAQTAYAASGIWQHVSALPVISGQDDTLETLYVASLDPEPGFQDAPALVNPASEAGEAALIAFTRPPPAGVIFELDERGLVRPTPEGALTPEGAVVFLGRPPVDAIQRPGGAVTPEAGETEPTEPVAEATETPETGEQSAERQRLAAIRPVQRPGDLSEQRERVVLGGRTRSELAAIRPIQRPASAQARAEAIARALLEADADNSAEEVEAALVAATARAVSNSRRALPRPRNFAQIVQAARQTPQRVDSAAIQTASASTAAAAPRASGPAVARSSRANPTGRVNARVARAATENNAIALGRVALVGVFGTSSNRRALVRMPNGRFKKVSVGDRVDGGRVAAISSSTLRYTKGGRTVTLEMPNG